MVHGRDRTWTTLWDRKNRRVLLLAGQKSEGHWSFVRHDTESSVAGVYDIWRETEDNPQEKTPPSLPQGEIVFVEIHLDDSDNPLGFPHHLLDQGLLGSPTIWPYPNYDSFIWWHGQG
jgi:hypothetical protein